MKVKGTRLPFKSVLLENQKAEEVSLFDLALIYRHSQHDTDQVLKGLMRRKEEYQYHLQKIRKTLNEHVLVLYLFSHGLSFCIVCAVRRLVN